MRLARTLIAIMTRFRIDLRGGAFRSVPDRARRPRRIQTVTALVSPADEDDLLRASAQELLTDLMNQFGITGRL